MPPSSNGSNHNGRPIVGKKIEIRKTGGEFSEDLVVANADALAGVKVGSRLTLAVDVICVDEHYPAEDRKEPDEGGVYHKLVFDPRETTIIERASVDAAFARQREVVQQARDDAAGNTTIASQLADQHADGAHAPGLVDGCPHCDEEKALAASEAKPRGRARK